MTSTGALPADWRVKLPAFEGPLDLLLHLVRINEVEITEIPVALVCDQFHEYLGLMEELNLDIAADYVYEAAYLVHLKSRLLLPAIEDEGGEEEDPRQDLVERLLEYRKLKDAAQSLAEIHSVRRGIWTRPEEKLSGGDEDSLDLSEVSLYDLLGALKSVLLRYDREHPAPLHLTGESFSTRDQFERLLDELARGRPVDLLDDLGGRSCRSEAVAAFLAVLELSRLNLIRLHQTSKGQVLMYRTKRQLEAHELEALAG
jgi:segregation and condensation protein A